MNGYVEEIWDREDFLDFLEFSKWDNIRLAIQARTEQRITMYRKGDMYYFPEQVI